MNYKSKLTLALAASSLLYPVAAFAGPTTGSTAAAVSIKFQDCKCGPNSGGFSINPGGNANGNGNGVQELSAAVATGETKANAESSSDKSGTNASARGYSKPVTFSYVTNSDVRNRTETRDYTLNETSQYNQAQESARSKIKSDYETYNATNRTQGDAANGTKGTGRSENETANSGSGKVSDGSSDSETSSTGKKSSSYSTSSNNSGGTKNTTEGSNSESTRSQSSNSQDGNTTRTTENTSDVSNKTKTGTTYEYTGSAAGLSYIPIIK
jgi:hypothetical protein